MIADSIYDAFTRWWLENVPGGGLPTPEDVKKFLPRLQRQKLLLDEERYVEIVQAELLVQGDPGGGVPPFDPAAEAERLAAVGIDPSKDQHLRKLAELVELGRRRVAKKGESDPRKPSRARSRRKEKVLRKKATRAAKGRSKVLRHSGARDLSRDRKILKEIHGFFEVSLPVRLTPHRRYVVKPPASFRSFGPKSTAHDKVIWIPHWLKATLPLRGMAFGIAAGMRGACDFTLHLGDTAIEYGMGVGEMKFAQRLYRKIWDALDAQCPRKGYPPPEFFFLVEKGVGERPHLHGVIVLPEKRSHKKHLRKVLLDVAGGDWKPIPNAMTQLNLGTLYEPAGWVNYILKYTEQTREELGDNIFACSRAITRWGRDWYNGTGSRGDLVFPGRAVPLPPKSSL